MTRLILFRILAFLSFFSAFRFASAEVQYSMPLKGTELPIGTLLDWATNLESDMQAFVVEKSEDGIHFDEMGTVQAAGFSKSDLKYRFMDLTATAKKTIYRLRELAVDGTSSFSDLAIVTKKMDNNLAIVNMSKPEITKEFKVTFDCLKESEVIWSVLNMQNEVIENGKISTINGLNDLRIDFQSLSIGTYTLKIQMGSETEQIVVNRVNDGFSDKPNVATTKKSMSDGRN